MAATLAPKLAVDRAPQARVHGTNSAKIIVLHSTESHDRPGTSDVTGILTYLEGKDYGVHYCVDGEGNIGRGAYHNQLVYHCKGANSRAVGIEMIGEAKWLTTYWFVDPKSRKARKQINAVAKLIAYIAREESIPLVLSTTHGICRHADIPEGGHWDPGPNFPLAYLMKRARFYKALYTVTKPKLRAKSAS